MLKVKHHLSKPDKHFRKHKPPEPNVVSTDFWIQAAEYHQNENSSQQLGFHSGCIFNTFASIVIERSYTKGIPEPIQQPIILQLHEHWQTAWGRSLSAAHAVSSLSSSGTCSSNLEGSDEAEPLGILLTLDYQGQSMSCNAKLITCQRGARQMSSAGLCWGQPGVWLFR